MARRYIPGYGSLPYAVTKTDLSTPEKFDAPSPQSTESATPTEFKSPLSALDSAVEPVYKPPVDEYLKNKVMQVDPFGQTSVATINTNVPASPISDTYWNNPARLHRYYTAIKSAPAGWKPPSFVDPKQVESMYRTMEAANGYTDWTHWKPLSETSPFFEQVKSMPLPPDEYLSPDEMKYKAMAMSNTGMSAPQTTTFENLPLWQQLLTYITPGQENIEGIPFASRGTSAGISGVIAGLGGAGMTHLALGGLALILGAPITGPVVAALPVIAGLTVGGAAIYQSMTNKEVPILNDMLQAFDFLSIAAERSIGTGMQVVDQGLEPFLRDYNKLSAAWKAGGATYESSKAEVINTFAKIMDFIDFNTQFFEVDAENLAKPGESWAFEYGYSKPVANTYEEGVVGLNTLRIKIEQMQQDGASDQDIAEEIEQFKASFYSSGANNDIVLGTVIDPANWMPFISSRGLEAGYRGTNPMLADSFRQSRGSLFIDSLPFGLQQGVEFLSNATNLGLRSSSGPLSAISEYKMRFRYSAPDAGKTAVDYSAAQKAYHGLTNEGKFAELQPKGKPRTGVVGRTLDFLEYMVSLNEDSKASVLLRMFQNTLSQVLLDPQMSTVQKMDHIQKIAGVKAYDINKVSERYLGSAAMLTVSDAFKYSVPDAVTMYKSFIDAQKDFIPFINNLATKLSMDPHDVAKSIGDKKALKVLKQKMKHVGMDPEVIVSDIKRMREGLIDGDIPLDEEHMWVEFTRIMYDKMHDYLVDTYKLAPESGLRQTVHVMKGVQNLVLLGWSPQYLYENFLGNKVAMAMVGVLSYMRPAEIRSIIAEFGLDPARIGEGYSPAGDITTKFDLAGSETKKIADEVKMRLANRARGRNLTSESGKAYDTNWGKVNQKVSGLTKLGIMSSLSAKVEAADSLQAFTTALLRFYSNEWKVDRGLRRSPMEQIWEQKYPGITKYLYSAIESSKNIPAVYKKLFSSLGKPNTSELMAFAARELNMQQEVLSQTLESTGVLSAIEKGLDAAVTVSDADNVYDTVMSGLSQHLADTYIRELKDADKNHYAKLKSEGIPAVLHSHTLIETLKLQEMLAGKKEWDALYQLQQDSKLTKTEFTKRVAAQFDKETQRWKDLNDKELLMLKGTFDLLGTDSEAAVKYINGVEEVHKIGRASCRERV